MFIDDDLVSLGTLCVYFLLCVRFYVCVGGGFSGLYLLLFFVVCVFVFFFFFSSRRRHTRYIGDWSSDVCSSDLSGCRSKASASAARIVPPCAVATMSRPRCCSVSRSMLRAARSQRSTKLSPPRSEERRVGKECRSRWSPDH